MTTCSSPLLKDLSEIPLRNMYTVIQLELSAASIIAIKKSTPPTSNNVPAQTCGILYKGGKPVATIYRYPKYFMIKDFDIPLDIANILYVDPIGKRDIRIGGGSNDLPPYEWAKPKYLYRYRRYHMTLKQLIESCNNGRFTAERFISTYYITSLDGLRLFTSTLRTHHLID